MNRLAKIREEQWNLDHIGSFDINFETGAAYWSRELRHMLAVPHDVPASFKLILDRIHRDDRRAFARVAAQTFQPNCPRYAVIEPRIVRPDGRVERVHIEAERVFADPRTRDVVRLVGFMIAAHAQHRLAEHGIELLSRVA